MSDKQKIKPPIKNVSQPTNSVSNTTKILIGLVIVVLLGLIGGIIYYYIKYNNYSKGNEYGKEYEDLDNKDNKDKDKDKDNKDDKDKDKDKDKLLLTPPSSPSSPSSPASPASPDSPPVPLVNINVNDTEALLRLAGVEKN